MPAGRPTKYDPAFCEKVEEFGAIGKSRIWIATELGVVAETMTEWAKVHPEFSVALTRAKQLEQRWWEDKGQNNLEADKFNGGMWAKNMAARFPKDWREAQDVNHGVQDNLADLLTSLDGKHARIPTAG